MSETFNARDAETLGTLKAEKANLEAELKKQQEAYEQLQKIGENKSIALDEERTKHKETKNQVKAIFTKLGIESIEEVDEMVKNAQGFQKMQEEKQAQTRANIEKYSQELGADFLNQKASFLQGLSEWQKEEYLAEHAQRLQEKDTSPSPSAEVLTEEVPISDIDKFQTLLNGGASMNELLRAID